jgi:hypothetical protein
MTDLHAVPPTDEPEEEPVATIGEEETEPLPTAVVEAMPPTAEADAADWVDQHAELVVDEAGDDEYPHGGEDDYDAES